MHTHTHSGYVVVSVLVFATIFLVILTSLTSFIFVQKKVQYAKESREQAMQIAEAGLEYYRWHLAHYPNDITDGTGEAGPYIHTLADPEGETVGSFSLEINGNLSCDIPATMTIQSTGWTSDDPRFTRTVFSKYARPSVAEYAYIINANVWAGDDRTILGRYHSNGGIRMDGENRSTVTSGVAQWLCSGSFGCSPSLTKPGIFGDGSGSDLWEFPVPPIDFTGITVDLVSMKDQASVHGGLYFPPSGRSGYRVVFRDNGTIDVYRVDSTSYVWGYTIERGWERDYHIIASQTFLGNWTIPPSCSVLFFEDDLWTEGVVRGKVTVASANVTTPNVTTDVILSGNITYSATDGSDGLTLIAENALLIPLLSPDYMELRGIFIAQKDQVGRHHYTSSGSYRVPASYTSYVKQSQLTIVGTIVSNGRVGTQWTSGGVWTSGYGIRNNAYDRRLATDPPPLTPYTSDEYRFVEWREEE